MSFITDRRGNFGIMTAIMMVPLLLVAGAATDYGMMSRNRSMLQDALDSGLLAAGKSKQPIGEQRKVAKGYVEAHAARLQMSGLKVEINPSASGKGLIGTATADYEPMLFRFPQVIMRPISVHSEVQAGADVSLDAALVLDNTGSLGDTGLQAVRTAARNFTASIFNAVDDPSRVKIGVVPFAAAVNVGRSFPRGMMDINGEAPWNGMWFENRWIARIGPPCPDIDWDEPTDPGPGTVESWLRSVAPTVQYAFDELLGVKEARAGEAQDHGMPGDYTTTIFQNCKFLVSPPRINNFDQFDGIANVPWAGCVEARADDFDTTDRLATSGNPDSLFVPYFWPDEPDQYENWVPEYVNNYMPDIGPSQPWSPADWATMEYWGRAQTITKYDGRSAALTGNASESGPNRGCPQPLLPLTKDQTSITNSINAMSLAGGGGTIVSEGVAWGWRVLSPAAPFTQASTGDNVKRVMIVMTDGENQISRNPQVGEAYRNSPMQSDYTAYGYLRSARLGTTFADMESGLDERTLDICSNAKSDNIDIYTVLFRSDSSRAKSVLSACATSPDKFYLAEDAEDLNKTFAAIAASIGRYRLVK